MWQPVSYAGLGAKHRLGQYLPQSAVDQAAKSVVAQAEPKVRDLIADERLRLADAGKTALPFVALSTAGFFATSFWATQAKIKLLGYTASAAALGAGLWLGFDILGGEPPAPPPPPSGDIPLVSESARQMAKAIVSEAMPVIEGLVEEERNRVSSSLVTMLPYVAGAVGGTLLTIFVVPNESGKLKVVGYTASAGAFLVGLWHGLEMLTT